MAKPDTSDAGSINPSIIHSQGSFPVEKFAIPTKTDSLSSGFPFHQRLYDLRVSHDEWHLFTNEIVEAAKLTTSENSAAIAAGVSTGLLSTGLLVFFGPVAGYYTGRSVHRKAVLKKVKGALMHEGPIRGVLRRWNDEIFHEKGIQAWLEMPIVKGEVNGNDQLLGPDGNPQKRTRKERKEKEKEERRYRIIIVPNTLPMSTSMSQFSGQSTWELSSTPVEAPQYLHGVVAEADSSEQKHPGVAELSG
ncbi:hypothetical protein CJF31_00003662 [Rutstroemia sp. NJR-2017a BVV2]|nr:hypothetical protein CJF31_00003662 [Rutstroemia sp. NJR-2017a BVV2]